MTPEAARSSHRRQIEQHGETILIRRYTGKGDARTNVDYSVRARVVEYRPDELVGNIKQGDRRLIVLAEDVEATAITLPVTISDRVVVRGKEMAIQALDDNTRRIAGVLVAYELQIRG